MNVENIIVCPKCKCALDGELVCGECGARFSRYHGVYDVIHPELSGDQEILWSVTDGDLSDEAKAAEHGNQEKNWREDYFRHKNEETRAAERKLDERTRELLKGLHGDVCDLATGLGGMLQLILDSDHPELNVVCTDISKRVLAWTRKTKGTDDERVSYVATDGRYLSLRDNSFDFVTSMAGFGNIPESGKVARELYRVLKKNGKLIIQGAYLEKGSKSFELARSVGVEKGMVEEYLIEELEKAGFGEIVSTVVDEAVWAENPYDLLPVAGDTQRFCIIQATRLN